MKLPRHLFLCSFFVLVAVCRVNASCDLFSNGETVYDIIVASKATPSEKTAAEEFQYYIEQLSGVKIPFGNRILSEKSHHIYIGYTDDVFRPLGIQRPDAEDDTFVYRTLNNDVYIYGGSQRGTMYGVFAFLEQQLGIRWFAPDCIYVPKLRRWALPELFRSESPAFKYRNLYTYDAIHFKSWSAHNLLNVGIADGGKNYGPSEYVWGAHTMIQLVSPKDFFKIHPEYFSLYNGKRIDNGQLCLSNPEVLHLLKERIILAIKSNPNHWCYDLSPADNENYCSCKNCQTLVKHYGELSGVVLSVVNEVADTVEKVFPDKMVGMFAYRSTINPPEGIIPRSNVLIRLCSMGYCRLHPLTDFENETFVGIFKRWQRLTSNVSVWNYDANFHDYLLPFPNFASISPNLRFFRDMHAVGVFQLGQYQSRGGEFAELRQWIEAKLLWNPDLDTDSLIHEFMKAYYGSASIDILKYYNLCQQQISKDWHHKIYPENQMSRYSDAFILRSQELLSHAHRSVAGDSVLIRRVERVMLPILKLKASKYKARSVADGTVRKMLEIMRRERPHINEKTPYDQSSYCTGYI